MNKLITKFNKKEDGFTLIELLVVVLILGILIAVAVPQFIGQQEKAGNTSAQVDLRTAYAAAAAVRVDNNGSFPTAANLRSGMVTAEPGLGSKLTNDTGLTPPLTALNPTNVGVPEADRIGWARLDGSNVVFFARASNNNIYCVSTKTGSSVRTVLAPTASPAVNSTVFAQCG